MTISFADIQALIDQFERSDWRRISLVADGVELSLSKDPVADEGRAAPPQRAGQPVPASSAPVAPSAGTGRGTAVTAPSLGTFYRSPRPGMPPFVELGGRVAAGDEICLIEVMKLLTSVRAPQAGVITAIHVEDGVLVEFGQVLMSIDADG